MRFPCGFFCSSCHLEALGKSLREIFMIEDCGPLQSLGWIHHEQLDRDGCQRVSYDNDDV